DAAVLATSVRVQAEAEADVGAVVLGEDRAARVAVEDGGRRRGVAVGVGLELDVERLVAVRGVRSRAPAGEVRTRNRGRLWPERQRGVRASEWTMHSAKLNVHVLAARSASQPTSPSRQRWRTAAFPSAPGRPAAFITRHSARHSGPGGPPPGTKKVGSQLRVE